MPGAAEEGFNAAKEGWYTELSTMWPGQGLSLEVKEVLFQQRSKFQDVCVMDTDSIYKRVLLLDGVIQCTNHDEFSYQEMITHLPLCALASPPKKVLIVGGGDGGVAREVAKHESVEVIDMVEIDEMVPEVSKKYFPAMAKGFADARLNLMIQDGIEWVKNSPEGKYDAIIVDSSDPVGPAEVLFQQPFFEYMHRALKPGGCVCAQAESLWLHLPIIESLASMCQKVFAGGSVQYAYTTVPTYPSGQIGFMVCCKSVASGGPLDAREPRRQLAGGLCKYYRPELHRAAFVLPQFAKQALGSKLTFAA